MGKWAVPLQELFDGQYRMEKGHQIWHGHSVGSSVRLYDNSQRKYRCARAYAWEMDGGEPTPQGKRLAPSCGEEKCILPEHNRPVLFVGGRMPRGAVARDVENIPIEGVRVMSTWEVG